MRPQREITAKRDETYRSSQCVVASRRAEA